MLLFGHQKESTFCLKKQLFFLTSNVNSIKAHRSATLLHIKYTREPLKYRKRTKFQRLRKIRNRQNYSMLLSMYKGIVPSFTSALTSHSHDLQSSLHSALFKDITLNKKEPSSMFTKQYGFPTVPSNSLTP